MSQIGEFFDVPEIERVNVQPLCVPDGRVA
jgi:hypothetical protein